MSKDNLMMLPSNCIVMNDEEKKEIEGGVNIGMTKGYLNKNICINVANGILKTYTDWKNVSRQQLAKEIFGHAVVYYKWTSLKKYGITNYLIYKHAADGVDLGNRVDRWQVIWNRIWEKY